MSTSEEADEATALPEERIAKVVFDALQTELAAQLRTVQGGLEALADRMTRLERAERGPGPRPNINPPGTYDGASRPLADQFISQVEAAAEFEVFRSERQKILWAQSYLTGAALAWSRVITTGSDDPEANPRRFHWEAWLSDFKAAFGLRDPAQDALNKLGVLQQGSRSITEYCTAFFELKGKLGPADANSEYVKDRFWKGLSATAMEALVNTDFTTAEEARDILLRRETRLADMVARRKGQWHGSSKASGPAPMGQATAPTPAAARVSNPPASKDPDAMDVDRAQRNTARKCFKCGKTGHLIAECPAWMASLKAAVREVIDADKAVGKREEQQPAAGFV